jgi:hypothetical protein
MNAQELLQEISEYCRHTGLAESTFDAAPSMTASSPAAAPRRPHHHRDARSHP